MDVISRQKAIDAIVNKVSGIGLHDNSEVARYGATFRQHEIIDIIESLPSVQTEIVRCKDCKFYTAYDYTGKLMCKRIGKGMILPKPEDYCSYAERIADGRD